jgi:hypothetical protein
MACDHQPLPKSVRASVTGLLAFDANGEIDYDAQAADIDGLRSLAELMAELADDRDRLLVVLRVPYDVWIEFLKLAERQLIKNLRANGLPKRRVPPTGVIENVMALGAAIRVADEAADLQPLLK